MMCFNCPQHIDVGPFGCQTISRNLIFRGAFVDRRHAMQSKMQAQAVSRVIHSGDWLTGKQVADAASLHGVDLDSHPPHWTSDGLVFSISIHGEDHYPRYALDAHQRYRPLPALKSILAVFGDWNGWAIAFWFDSPNSHLGGLCPKELLVLEPERVLFAAESEVQGVGHG
jgi:hypothetical protein